MLQELDRLATELGANVTIFGVAVPREQLPESVIKERLAQLQVKLPVLRDVGFNIGQRLRVTSVPNLSLVDGAGKLQMSNAASLAQVVGYNVTVESAVRRLAESGSVMNYGYLDRYFPVTELEGATSPDFRAPLLSSSVEQRWHSMIDDSKVNVLIFWSVDCPHCRKTLPEIDAWVKANPEGLNVVTCANVMNEAAKTKTAEFCKLSGFSLPTLVDDRARIGNLYKVTSTPTIVIVGPDGVVDSTIVSGHKDFAETMEEKKRSLLKSNPSS
jgi:thiol-disulfide isomerase/thioredoxin